MLKKNMKLIAVFILGIVSAVGITVIASGISGKNILVKVNGWNVKNLEEAVDYLKDENQCAGLKPEPIIAHVTSGDKNTVGSIVRIGEEDFYVIGQGTGNETGKTKLLAKFALKDNKQVSSGAETSKFSTTEYWSSRNLSYNSSPKPYVYDENSKLYNIVQTYVEKINNLGISKATGRLLSYEEANALSIDIRKSVGSWIYWLGSAESTSSIWCVTDSGEMGYNGPNGWYFAIRPVILVPTNKIG